MLGLRSSLASLTVVAALSSGCAHSDRAILASPTSVAPESFQMLSVEVVAERGSLPAYLYGGSVFLEARHGESYALRLTNNSAERVEAVVSVDGRDVVSGELGNYNKQRGYVLQPWETVMVDGFRRSLDSVAAFRFSELAGSYTARMGTPQHAGVIGVAVFRERSSRRRRKHPVAPTARPYYDSDVDRGVDYSASDDGAPFPEASAQRERAAPRGGRGAYSPSPVEANDLGTAYGETRTSVVHQTKFRRRRARRPDALLTLYYDSRDGLTRRGVLPSYTDDDRRWTAPYEARPFDRDYAEPPPGPPLWWD